MGDAVEAEISSALGVTPKDARWSYIKGLLKAASAGGTDLLAPLADFGVDRAAAVSRIVSAAPAPWVEARDAIAELRGSGYSLVVCSDLPSDLARSYFERHGLAGYIDDFVCADAVGFKWGPRCLPRVSDMFPRAYYASDEAEDALAARAAGMEVIHVGEGGCGCACYHERSLRDAARLIKKLGVSSQF